MDRVLLSLEVTETTKNRDYWARREWAANSADKIRAADILIVPWEDFRDEAPALFPQGTSDFFKGLTATLGGQKVAIAIDREQFKEIALHANERRLPTLFLSVLAVPMIINILSNHVDKWLFESPASSSVEIALLVEGPMGRCVNVKYKGPASDLVKTIEQQVSKCFPVDFNSLTPSKKSAVPKARSSKSVPKAQPSKSKKK